MHDLRMHDNRKFATHFIRPFKVLKYTSKLAYCIELPPIYSALHSVFHVSKRSSMFLAVMMGLVPIYSRFWLIVKNSMRLRRL